jgi:hypothetical protein
MVKFFLILAIGTRLLSKTADSRLLFDSYSYFRTAISDIKRLHKCLLPISTSSLQCNVLLCIFLLLDPSWGNVWRVMGHTCRLSLELNSLRANEDDPGELEAALYRTVYQLER